MNRFLFIVFMLGTLIASAQEWGMSVAYGTDNMIGVDFLIKDGVKGLNTNGHWHVGFVQQQSGQHGARRQANTSNYGRTSQGGSKFFSGFDLGYSKAFGKIRVHAEATLGSDVYFTNYSDLRFETGGYYSVNGRESVAGGGADIAYTFGESMISMDVFAGYNTVKGVNFGIRFLF